MSEPYGPPGGYPNQPPPWPQPGAGQGPTQPVSGGGTPPGYPPQYGTPQPYAPQPYGAPFGQPSYGAPQGQQPYGAPQGQPGYGAIPGQQPYGTPQGQPPYGAAQPQPPYGAAQPQPPYGAVPGQPPYGAPEKSRSRGPLIAVIAVVAVLLVGGITAAVVIGGSGDNKNQAGSSSTTGSGGGSTGGSGNGSTGGGRNVTFNAPDKVGSLKKMSSQDQVDPMKDSLRSAGIDNPFAVAYEDSSNAHHTVTAWGGSGKAFELGSAQTELDAFFKSAVASIEGGHQGSVKKVDAGSLGGTAECADVSGLDQATSLCAWTNREALLGFVFDGFSPSESQSHVRGLLPALVTLD